MGNSPCGCRDNFQNGTGDAGCRVWLAGAWSVQLCVLVQFFQLGKRIINPGGTGRLRLPGRDSDGIAAPPANYKGNAGVSPKGFHNGPRHFVVAAGVYLNYIAKFSAFNFILDVGPEFIVVVVMGGDMGSTVGAVGTVGAAAGGAGCFPLDGKFYILGNFKSIADS